MSDERVLALRYCQFALSKLQADKVVDCSSVDVLLEHFRDGELHLLTGATEPSTCPLTRAFSTASACVYSGMTPCEVTKELLGACYRREGVPQAILFFETVLAQSA